MNNKTAGVFIVIGGLFFIAAVATLLFLVGSSRLMFKSSPTIWS
jgi:hypothetical protein